MINLGILCGAPVIDVGLEFAPASCPGGGGGPVGLEAGAAGTQLPLACWLTLPPPCSKLECTTIEYPHIAHSLLMRMTAACILSKTHRLVLSRAVCVWSDDALASFFRKSLPLPDLSRRHHSAYSFRNWSKQDVFSNASDLKIVKVENRVDTRNSNASWKWDRARSS